MNLQNEIDNLEQQEQTIIKQLEYANDQAQRQLYSNSLENVRNKLSEKRAEMDQYLQQRQDIVTAASDPASSFVIAVEGSEINFRDLGLTEENYQLAYIAVQLKLQEVERDHAAAIAKLKDSYDADLTAQRRAYDNLDAELDQVRADLTDVRVKLENAHNQIADLEIERDNAKAEATTLRQQVDELRNAAPKPQGPTNLDSSALAEAIRKANAAKPAIYNKRPGDNRTSFYLATLAETGEEINIPWTQIGGYREVTPEEAERFRAESEAAKAVETVAQGVADDISLVTPEIPDFRDETGSVGDTSEGSGDHVEPVGETPSLEERVAKLELVVFGDKRVSAA